MIDIVFETHSLGEDNERGIATGWLPSRPSVRGREFAAPDGWGTNSRRNVIGRIVAQNGSKSPVRRNRGAAGSAVCVKL
jgi:hypothetical protein